MLDIYLATFTTISLIGMILYILTSSYKWAIFSALFEGLAIGSKTSWDAIIAFLVSSVTILYIEGTRRVSRNAFKRLVLYTLVALVSFGITSPVTIIRFKDHVRSVLAYHAPRIGISSMFSQPLTSSNNYSIFIFEHPILLLLTSIIVFTLCYATMRRDFENKGDRLLLSSLLIMIFLSLEILLTSVTFEYGRNYARLTLYECLATSVLLAHLLRGRRFYVRFSVSIIVSLFLIIALYSYWYNLLVAGYFFRYKQALASKWMLFESKEPIGYLIPWLKLGNLVPLVGYLFLIATLSSLASFILSHAHSFSKGR